MKQDGVLLENLLTSTEIFDTETETWSDGPELPISLAFATVVSTPLATFIMGGQTVGGDPSSATGKVLRGLGQNSKQTGRSMLPDMYFLN